MTLAISNSLELKGETPMANVLEKFKNIKLVSPEKRAANLKRKGKNKGYAYVFPFTEKSLSLKEKTALASLVISVKEKTLNV